VTHYIPIYAKFVGVREKAICGEYVLQSRHSSTPTCERCQDLLAEDDQKREREKVSIAEVVERY
jgi:hypothetical protein